MGNMERPDKRQVAALISQMEQADYQLNNILRQKTYYESTIKRIYGNTRLYLVNKALEELSIEELNKDKSGIRISALRNAGYSNVLQLVDKTAYQLAQINGIGDDSAQKIVLRVRAITEYIQQSTSVKIQATDKDKDNCTIVLCLAILMHTRELVDNVKALHLAHHTGLLSAVKMSKDINSVIKWFFLTPGKKRARLNAYSYLNNLKVQGVDIKAQQLDMEFQIVVNMWKVENSWNDFVNNTAPYYALLEEITGISTVSKESQKLLPEELVKAINEFTLDTSAMKSVLRSYQTFGTKYILHQQKTLLGDEMGLGKTIQAIAAMAHLYAQGRGHFIVICPVSVMINWKREIGKHSQLEAIKIHGDNRDEAFEEWKQRGGVGVTTYETVSKLGSIQDVYIDMLVVDEAHYVKNPEAIRTQAVAEYVKRSEYILFMTGTPLENKVEEMVFLISLLNEQIAAQAEKMQDYTMAASFRKTIAPVYLRRIRKEVLSELPEKTEKDNWCELNEVEELAYKHALMFESHMKIRQVSWNVAELASSSKAERLLEICEEAKEDGRKIIVFSYFLDVIDKVMMLLGDMGYGPITGSVSADDRQKLVDEFAAAPAGSVLVSQINAGGVGLNIQSASVVVICEPQWKPSTENQAISRVYRMGQARNVIVHRLLMDNTVDEHIVDILKNKTEIFEHFADESIIDEASKKINEGKAMKAIVAAELERYGLEKKEENE